MVKILIIYLALVFIKNLQKKERTCSAQALGAFRHTGSLKLLFKSPFPPSFHSHWKEQVCPCRSLRSLRGSPASALVGRGLGPQSVSRPRMLAPPLLPRRRGRFPPATSGRSSWGVLPAAKTSEGWPRLQAHPSPRYRQLPNLLGLSDPGQGQGRPGGAQVWALQQRSAGLRASQIREPRSRVGFPSTPSFRAVCLPYTTPNWPWCARAWDSKLYEFLQWTGPCPATSQPRCLFCLSVFFFFLSFFVCLFVSSFSFFFSFFSPSIFQKLKN